MYKIGETNDGVYLIDPDGQGSYEVRCDMTTDGGGWTVLQRRLNGSEDFYRGWTEYKYGFGNKTGEFWQGLDKIHRMTKSEKNVLRVDLEDFDGNTTYAKYDKFEVASDSEKYRLTVGNFSGEREDYSLLVLYPNEQFLVLYILRISRVGD